MRSFTRVSLLLTLLALICACTVMPGSVNGPAAVSVGETATYTLTFANLDGPVTNATAYGYVDIPAGWTFQQGSFSGTINGVATTGPVTLAPTDPGVCTLPPVAAGYQRLILQAGPFANGAATDQAIVSLALGVGGTSGSFVLDFWGGGASSGGAASCQATPSGGQSPPPVIFQVTVTSSIPALGKLALAALAALVLAAGWRFGRRRMA